MSDQEIIVQLKKGNYKDFKHLYKHYGLIQNYVLKNNGTSEDAKDMFQNALITLYNNTKKEDFELTSKISTYLFSIARNSWLKKITRNRETIGFDRVLADGEVNYDEQETSDPDDSGLSVGDYLQTILKKIGEPCKSLIVFFHFDKLSWEEIATRLHYKTAHAARNQKYKCFLKIRKLIPESDKIKLFNHGS